MMHVFRGVWRHPNPQKLSAPGACSHPQIATGAADNNIRQWEACSGGRVAQSKGHFGTITGLSYTLCGLR